MVRASIVLGIAVFAGAAGDPREVSVRLLPVEGDPVEGDRLLAVEGKIGVGRAAPDAPPLALRPLEEVLEVSFTRPAEAAPRPRPAAPGGKDAVVEVEFVNRDLVRGVVVRGDGETGFVLRSDALGEVPVPLERVATLRVLASWEAADDPPPLAPGPGGDRLLFPNGDRLDGTLRSVDAREVRVRTSGGADRAIPLASLLGFALAPAGAPAEGGLRVQALLRDGSRVSGSGIQGSLETGFTLRGALGSKEDRALRPADLAGLAVRGGRSTALSDLVPASVEVKPYWGDDPPVADLRPRMDRAFTLDPGPAPPLRLGGRVYARGVSMFSGTTVAYDLRGKGFRRFVASVGVDDAGPRGAVEFEVLLDGRSAWRSGPVRALPAGKDPLPVPPVDLRAAARLELRVHAGPDDDVQDYADWVRAALIP